MRSSLSHAVIALEIVDFRFDSPPTLPDLISDHALAAYFVVGSDVAIPEGAETVTLTSNDPKECDKSVVGTVAPRTRVSISPCCLAGQRFVVARAAARAGRP